MPRWPGGWFAGSSHSSRPGWPSSVDSFDQRLAAVAALADAGRLGADEHAPVARPRGDETFEIFRSSSCASPSLECAHVSPLSPLRQTAEPCHSLAAAA